MIVAFLDDQHCRDRQFDNRQEYPGYDIVHTHLTHLTHNSCSLARTPKRYSLQSLPVPSLSRLHSRRLHVGQARKKESAERAETGSNSFLQPLQQYLFSTRIRARLLSSAFPRILVRSVLYLLPESDLLAGRFVHIMAASINLKVRRKRRNEEKAVGDNIVMWQPCLTMHRSLFSGQ